MTRRLLLMIAIGALGACAPAPVPAPPQDTAADEAKLRADLPLWFEHYNNGNADGVAAQYAEDAVLMPPNAPPAGLRFERSLPLTPQQQKRRD